jgi:hypothetical protein
MKKMTLVLFSLTMMALYPACGNDKGADGQAAATTRKAETATPAGKTYDCTYFTMSVAEGWEAGPLTFGMVNILPKGKVSPGLYFKFEGNGNAAGTAEDSIGTMIRNYGGSPMEESSIAGIGFKTTTYTYSGMTQTMHVAFRKGTKITITIEGIAAKDDPGIMAMIASVKLK